MVMKKHVLFIVENNSVPGDKRVWSEACAIREIGYDVTAISPKKNRAATKYEEINHISIYRYPRPLEAHGKSGFLIEYANALFWEFFLCLKIFLKKVIFFNFFKKK